MYSAIFAVPRQEAPLQVRVQQFTWYAQKILLFPSTFKLGSLICFPCSFSHILASSLPLLSCSLQQKAKRQHCHSIPTPPSLVLICQLKEIGPASGRKCTVPSAVCMWPYRERPMIPAHTEVFQACPPYTPFSCVIQTLLSFAASSVLALPGIHLASL